eukprot:scaffold18046_cov114-Isochrysis_galbana.AAC.2
MDSSPSADRLAQAATGPFNPAAAAAACASSATPAVPMPTAAPAASAATAWPPCAHGALCSKALAAPEATAAVPATPAAGEVPAGAAGAPARASAPTERAGAAVASMRLFWAAVAAATLCCYRTLRLHRRDLAQKAAQQTELVCVHSPRRCRGLVRRRRHRRRANPSRLRGQSLDPRIAPPGDPADRVGPRWRPRVGAVSAGRRRAARSRIFEHRLDAAVPLCARKEVVVLRCEVGRAGRRRALASPHRTDNLPPAHRAHWAAAAAATSCTLPIVLLAGTGRSAPPSRRPTPLSAPRRRAFRGTRPPISLVDALEHMLALAPAAAPCVTVAVFTWPIQVAERRLMITLPADVGCFPRH